ncbi:anthrone oxygenase family protein [Pseudonocardia sp. WMMC193]|uniref:anthrone oxygenase family protein n=1 Tax=Pseudonocardia sp. WMMC193 TaxID=2911965 RepID=UPI001F21739D|nr:anthrone oxygenase family protein [Pseudonocardia sp. WMMC193]MCF7552436.1 DUF1772 domain-containing protein [Pseudonocardia sp. WMMC193]
MNALVIGTAIGAGLLAGIYLAFSVAVMPGLHRRPDGEAADAMRAINRAIVNPLFGVLFTGTGLAGAVLAVWAALDGSWQLAAGAALVLTGGHLITIGVNIPLNTALDRGGSWDGFARPWNRAHTLRTLLLVVGFALLVV